MELNSKDLSFADDLRVEILKYKSLAKFKLTKKPTKDVQTEAGCINWLECFGLSGSFDRDSMTVTIGVGLEYDPAELISTLAYHVEQHLAAHNFLWYALHCQVSETTAHRWKQTGKIPAKHWPFSVKLQVLV